MTRSQIVRLGVVSLIVAAVQTAGLDRVLLLGVVSVTLPAYLSVAVGARLLAAGAQSNGFACVRWSWGERAAALT